MQPVKMRLSILLTLALCSAAECSRILVFICEAAKSHHLVYHPIIRALAMRGHRVDYYTHYPLPNPPETLNQIVLSSERLDQALSSIETFDATKTYIPLPNMVWRHRLMKWDEWSVDCFNSQIFRDLLATNKTYDAVIGEFFFNQEDFSTLIHRFNALGIAVISMPGYHWVNEQSGLSFNPSYMVHFASLYSDQMTFFERLYNFYEISVGMAIDYYYLVGPLQRNADKYMRYVGWESRPSISKLVSDLALILVSTHHSLDYPFPKAPHFKEIMGTNVEENPPPLPQDFQTYIDNAEHGVIYFSIGTVVSNKVLESAGAYEPLIKVFSNLKQKVIWKWTSRSNEEPPKHPNIKFSKWVPQQSVLAHKNVKLFITHGGLGSLTEAVYHGVPMIGLPVLGDQPKNVLLMGNLGLGIAMRLENVTEKSMSWAINEILNNPRYREAAAKRSAVFRDRPMKPVEESVYWIEYVLRHGKVLQPASATMPLYQLYLLDVIGFILLCLTATVFVLVRLTRFGLRKVQGICSGAEPTCAKEKTKKNN